MSDEQAKEDERETPSIIVDPSLTQDAAEQLQGGLTDADADRAADSIRPSWAPTTPPPTTAPRAPSERPPAASAFQGGTAPPQPERSERMAEDALLAGTRRRKRRGQLLVLIAAVAVAAVLLVPLISSVNTPAPSTPEPTSPSDVRREVATASPPSSVDPAGALEGADPSAPATARMDAPLEVEPPAAQPATATPEAPAVDGSPVMFRIRTVPRHAKLFIDGEPVDNPFDGPVPGGRNVVIEARARHFIPTQLTATSDRDRIIGVSLKRRKRKR